MLVALLSFALALQTTAPASPLTAEQAAEIALVAPKLGPTMETLGACETLFP